MRRSVRYGLYGAVLAGVTVAATAAFAAPAQHRRTITVVVDGTPQTVTTTSGTVAGVLAAAGVTAHAHDLVAPAPASAVTSGQTIVLKHGRKLELSIDGRNRTVWTTAPTVASALAALGFGQADFVSVSRSRRLPLAPTSLELRAPKYVVVVHDGIRSRVTTTDATVAALLRDMGIRAARTDVLNPPASAAVTDHLRVVLERVRYKRVVRRETLDYATVRHNDPAAYRGGRAVVTAGAEGAEKYVYSIKYVDRHLVSRILLRKVRLSSPVTQVETVGTKVRPSAPTVSSSGGLNWNAVAACESGGNWAIDTGNGFYGGLQFSESTWLAEGGGAYASRPDQASPDQQIAIATKLYQASGSSPWPVCGANL